MTAPGWDYLIVTAAHEAQAAAYREQLGWRRDLGFIPRVRQVLTIADPLGRRVGSGGSTIHCLLTILGRELHDRPGRLAEPEAWAEALRSLRVLIIHAGGDSRRLPAYSPCGKIFVPVPGDSDRVLGLTLFDRQLPTYLKLPPGTEGQGQVVIATGDVLLTFDPARVRFDRPGITGLGCLASPEVAREHGVFCAGRAGRVRRFLQKPTPAEQGEHGALDRHGEAILDIGVMSFDAETALRLLGLCDVEATSDRELHWRGPLAAAIEARGLDFYREVCCALGEETTRGDYLLAARRAGSAFEDAELEDVFGRLSGTPFGLELLPRCGFLHFGSTRDLITSGSDLMSIDRGTSHHHACLQINNEVVDGRIAFGRSSWIEGCRISAPLDLGGDNVVVGADLETPLQLPARAVLDVLPGRTRGGEKGWFVRCYSSDDVLHRPTDAGGSLAGRPLGEWLGVMDAQAEDVWDAARPPSERSAWNGRFFPAVARNRDHVRWHWLLDPSRASPEERRGWRAADRYSFAEMLGLADLDAFHERRLVHRSQELRRSLPRLFGRESELSARELALLWRRLDPPRRERWLADVIRAACAEHARSRSEDGLERLELSRILHGLGSAVLRLEDAAPGCGADLLQGVDAHLDAGERQWLRSLGLEPGPARDPRAWAEAAREAAFAHLGRVIVLSTERATRHPRNALRSDEIIWGRAPARLDLGGGWTDTPPYALEHGGSVINAAVDLNGQPPIHAYARVVPELEVRLVSIDQGSRLVVTTIEALADYREPTSQFGIAKAALALTGFSPAHATWPDGVSTLPEMLRLFGGGIELTTLAAIPSGSGLGTSSIVGAALLAVLARLIGRTTTPRELFNGVLQLEQELTTGGGWQDQIGGVVPGVKMITTEPGMIPDPRIHFVPPDLLDPRSSGGATLLYYTGLRRLAKNILQTVVGNYLDRDRAGMETLRQLHAFPPRMAAALAAKDASRFGRLIDAAWSLNKELDPDSTTPEIEGMLESVARHVSGAKLLGAGGGGFLLMVARSPADADAVRHRLTSEPPNPRARFFDFAVAENGLVVTVC
jgi:galactokinase/mevalonate kinase-like predicted kinase